MKKVISLSKIFASRKSHFTVAILALRINSDEPSSMTTNDSFRIACVSWISGIFVHLINGRAFRANYQWKSVSHSVERFPFYIVHMQMWRGIQTNWEMWRVEMFLNNQTWSHPTDVCVHLSMCVFSSLYPNKTHREWYAIFYFGILLTVRRHSFLSLCRFGVIFYSVC